MKIWQYLKYYLQRVFAFFGLELRKARSIGSQIAASCHDQNIDVVLDVGANKGQFIQELENLKKGCKIYFFEPIEVCFRELERRSAMLDHEVHLFNCALGDSVGTEEIHHHIDHQSSSSILETTAQSVQKYAFTAKSEPITVNVKTLDSLYQDSSIKLDGVVLLKLDVQGYEDRVLRGAKELLSHVSVVLLEVCIEPLYESQAKFSELVTLLDEAGFSYRGNVSQTYDGGYRTVYLDALFSRD